MITVLGKSFSDISDGMDTGSKRSSPVKAAAVLLHLKRKRSDEVRITLSLSFLAYDLN